MEKSKAVFNFFRYAPPDVNDIIVGNDYRACTFFLDADLVEVDIRVVLV
jgi:hypothetical protein